MVNFVTFDASRRKKLASVITQVLTPAQLTMANALVVAENPGRPAPRPEQLLHWMRLNMPMAAQRVDEILHPAD